MSGAQQGKLVVVGGGWHSEEVHSYLLRLRAERGVPELVGCVDEFKPRGQWETSRFLGKFDDLRELIDAEPEQSFFYITAVGDNGIRRKLVGAVNGLGLRNLRPWTLRHPLADVGYDVRIGDGTLLAPGVIVTTHVRVGNHCILNVKSSLSHDCVIGDYVNINPCVTVCGNVRIGEGAYIGAGATIIDKLSIGSNSVIGAGAVVIDDIPPNVTAVGVPARVIKQHAL